MSMPQGGEPGRPWDAGQNPGAPGSGNAPGQGGVGGQQNEDHAASYGAPAPAYGGQHYAPPEAAYAGGGRLVSPVNVADTHVTGRRVVQYIIDYLITGAIGSLIMWALDRGTGGLNVALILIGVVINIAWYFWYWVLRPFQNNGQTFGMQLLKLRVISKDGGPASMMQLFIRGILLIVDTLIWGLVGFITIICSHYRQRVGDHAAKTLVVQAGVEPVSAPRQFARAGQAGTR